MHMSAEVRKRSGAVADRDVLVAGARLRRRVFGARHDERALTASLDGADEQLGARTYEVQAVRDRTTAYEVLAFEITVEAPGFARGNDAVLVLAERRQQRRVRSLARE